MNAARKVVLFFKSHVGQYVRKDGTVVKEHEDSRTKKAALLYHPASASMREPKPLPHGDRKEIDVAVVGNDLLFLSTGSVGYRSVGKINGGHVQENIAWMRAIGHKVNVLNEGKTPSVTVEKRSGSWVVKEK